MSKKTIRDIDVSNKKVLVRVDFNVPLDEQQHITDDTRIKAALPTIRYLLDNHAAVILMSHLGRPKGRTETLSLTPVAQRLSTLLSLPVAMAEDCVGDDVTQKVAALESGQVLLLENLRFHGSEEKNDDAFAQQLASLADIYVNDAFGTAHRAHASTEGVTHHLPSVAGSLIEKEIAFLGSTLEQPKRPFVAIIGGAKVSDKIMVLERLIGLADTLLIGGGMANTFLKAKGFEIGDSLYEEAKVETARQLIEQAQRQRKDFVLPIDVVIADRFAADATHKVVAADEVPQGWRILDIGPATVEQFRQILAKAETIIWNGTLGVAEMPAFAKGTNEVIDILTERTVEGATTIIGGGDSAAAVEQASAANKMSHVSTGGGASLEFLEGRTLPGIAALQEA
jgi:phosphoglycerate kinase